MTAISSFVTSMTDADNIATTVLLKQHIEVRLLKSADDNVIKLTDGSTIMLA